MCKEQREDSPFSTNVRRLIRLNGFTLKDLAERSGVRYDWLRRAVAKGVKPTWSNESQIGRIAASLGVDQEKLYSWEKPNGLEDLWKEVDLVMRMCRSFEEHYRSLITRRIDALYELFGIQVADQTEELHEQLHELIFRHANTYYLSRDITHILSPLAHKGIGEQEPQHVAAYIRNAIGQKGLSLRQMSENAGVRYDWLRRALTKNVKITKGNINQFTRVAAALRIELKALLRAQSQNRRIDMSWRDFDDMRDIFGMMRDHKIDVLERTAIAVVELFNIDYRLLFGMKQSDWVDEVGLRRAWLVSAESKRLTQQVMKIIETSYGYKRENKICALLSPIEKERTHLEEKPVVKWEDAEANEWHPAQCDQLANYIYSQFEDQYVGDRIVRAMNAFWENNNLTEWDKCHIPLLEEVLSEGE